MAWRLLSAALMPPACPLVGALQREPRRARTLIACSALLAIGACAESTGSTLAFSDAASEARTAPDTASGEPEPTTDGGTSADVESEATVSDAPIAEAGQSCASACAGIGDCRLGICVIDCSGFNACSTGMTCPAGVPCRIDCSDGGCQGPIDCGQASSCEIDCGSNGCSDTLKCGGSECHIICGGTSSCDAAIDCTAQRCDIECSGTSSCNGKISCSGDDCTVDCGGTNACDGGACCSATTCNVFPITNT